MYEILIFVITVTIDYEEAICSLQRSSVVIGSTVIIIEYVGVLGVLLGRSLCES